VFFDLGLDEEEGFRPFGHSAADEVFGDAHRILANGVVVLDLCVLQIEGGR
jgi:hypothetical protein